MKIKKYKGISGVNITQVQLSDNDIESRLSKEQKELSKDKIYKMWNVDGKQRV